MAGDVRAPGVARRLSSLTTAEISRGLLLNELRGGLSYRALGDLLNELEARLPHDPGVQIWIARQERKIGQPERAEERLRAALRRSGGRSVLYPADDASLVRSAAKNELDTLTSRRANERRAVEAELDRQRQERVEQLRAEALERERLEKEQSDRALAEDLERQCHERREADARRAASARMSARARPDRSTFHMMHIANLELVLKQGGLKCDRSAEPRRQIGNPEIKSDRLRKTVVEGARVGDFVPFYLTPWTPMMYIVVTRTLPERGETADDLVVLVSDSNLLMHSGRRCFVTDGNAASNDTRTFEPASPAAVDGVPDWDVIIRRQREPAEAKRRLQAEFLVESDVPTGYLQQVAFHSQARCDAWAERLTLLAPHLELVVQPSWFR